MDQDQKKLFVKCIAAMASIVAIRSDMAVSVSPADWELLCDIRSNLALIYALETHGGPDDPIWQFADIDAPMMI